MTGVLSPVRMKAAQAEREYPEREREKESSEGLRMD
jgi:hypothetical protein